MICVYRKLSLQVSNFTHVKGRGIARGRIRLLRGCLRRALANCEKLQEESPRLWFENIIEGTEESDVMGKLEMRIEVQYGSNCS